MPKIIGITGGSGSGKSTVVKRIKERYPNAVLIEMDNYYKSATFVNNNNITAIILMLSIWILCFRILQI